jgi:uncharacterized membrane protein
MKKFLMLEYFIFYLITIIYFYVSKITNLMVLNFPVFLGLIMLWGIILIFILKYTNKKQSEERKNQ